MHNWHPEQFSGFQTSFPRKFSGAAVLTNGYFSVTGFLKKDLTMSPNIDPIGILTSKQPGNERREAGTHNDH
mgnify:CR=1 FL=1